MTPTCRLAILISISLGLFIITPGCDNGGGGGDGTQEGGEATSSDPSEDETGGLPATGTEDSIDCDGLCEFNYDCAVEAGEESPEIDIAACVDGCTSNEDGMADIVANCQGLADGSCTAYMECMRDALAGMETGAPPDLPELD